MKHWLLPALLVVGLLGISCSCWAADDWQYWSQFEVKSSINANLDFKVKPELRYNNDINDHYYTHFEVGIDWKINDWFVFGPYYRHVNQKKGDDWQVEYRPHLNGTFSGKFLGLSVSDRNRMEYRFKEDKEFLRYRNKATVKLPKYTQFKIQPYVAEEPFYDFDADEINKNRLYAGADLQILTGFKASVYFIYENNLKDDEWTSISILVTALKYSF